MLQMDPSSSMTMTMGMEVTTHKNKILEHSTLDMITKQTPPPLNQEQHQHQDQSPPQTSPASYAHTRNTSTIYALLNPAAAAHSNDAATDPTSYSQYRVAVPPAAPPKIAAVASDIAASSFITAAASSPSIAAPALRAASMCLRNNGFG